MLEAPPGEKNMVVSVGRRLADCCGGEVERNSVFCPRPVLLLFTL